MPAATPSINLNLVLVRRQSTGTGPHHNGARETINDTAEASTDELYTLHTVPALRSHRSLNLKLPLVVHGPGPGPGSADRQLGWLSACPARLPRRRPKRLPFHCTTAPTAHHHRCLFLPPSHRSASASHGFRLGLAGQEATHDPHQESSAFCPDVARVPAQAAVFNFTSPTGPVSTISAQSTGLSLCPQHSPAHSVQPVRLVAILPRAPEHQSLSVDPIDRHLRLSVTAQPAPHRPCRRPV